MNNDELIRILGNWGIFEVSSMEEPELGTLNRTWMIQHGTGKGVLRLHRTTEVSAVQFEHDILDRLESSSIPAPRVIPTREGQAFLVDQGLLWTLYTWEPGIHIRRGALSDQHAEQMGVTLARIHVELSGIGGGKFSDRVEFDRTATIKQLNRYLKKFDVSESPAEFEWSESFIHDQIRWLENSSRAVTRYPTETQLIHGDYQDTNILFLNDNLSSVIDWDRCRRSIPEREIVRTMHHGLGMQESACRSFLDGYQRVRKIPNEDLRLAVHWFSEGIENSVWVFEQIFDEGNTKIDTLMLNERFVPFEHQLETAGLMSVLETGKIT